MIDRRHDVADVPSGTDRGGRATVAVIGCGHWAVEAHLPSLRDDERAVTVGVADTDPAKLGMVRELFGVERLFTSATALLEAMHPDAVVVALPHALHAEIGSLVLNHEAHLLLEKPMVLDPADGRSLISLASERNRELIVGYPWNFDPQTLQLRSILEAEGIGEIEALSCTYASDTVTFYSGDTTAYQESYGFVVPPTTSTYSDPSVAGGGQGQTQLTHAFGLLEFVTGLRAVGVSASVRNRGLKVDVIDGVLVEYENGAIGTFLSTGALLRLVDPVFEFRIFGSRGHVIWDVIAGRLEMFREDRMAITLTTEGGADRYPLFAPAQNLVGVALGVAKNGSPPEPALGAVEVLDAMYRSVRAGGRPTRTSQ